MDYSEVRELSELENKVPETIGNPEIIVTSKSRSFQVGVRMMKPTKQERGLRDIPKPSNADDGMSSMIQQSRARAHP